MQNTFISEEELANARIEYSEALENNNGIKFLKDPFGKIIAIKQRGYCIDYFLPNNVIKGQNEFIKHLTNWKDQE